MSAARVYATAGRPAPLMGERLELARFRCRHLGDPQAFELPFEVAPADHGIRASLAGDRGSYFVPQRGSRNAWRGTRERALSLAAAMQRSNDKSGGCWNYDAAPLPEDGK